MQRMKSECTLHPYVVRKICWKIQKSGVYRVGRSIVDWNVFFSIYRPSCHIEAYIRPEKYCFVWAGPLANHHSILTSFYLATAKRQRRKERHVLLIWTAASQAYSAATDGRRAAKLAWGVAWPFGRKTLPVEKSSEFKFGEYGSQSAENQNSANGR